MFGRVRPKDLLLLRRNIQEEVLALEFPVGREPVAERTRRRVCRKEQQAVALEERPEARFGGLSRHVARRLILTQDAPVRACGRYGDCVSVAPPKWRHRALNGGLRAHRNEPMPEQEPWASIEDVTKHLGIARDTVYRWLESKGLPAPKLARLLKFKLSQADEWMANAAHLSIRGGKE